MGTYQVIRRHEIHCGHRVHLHEGACKNLHGHSYVVHFYCQAPELDSLGRVIDFGVLKVLLCKWLDDNFDHRTLIWQEDPLAITLPKLDPSVVIVPFNPTAENIARYICEVIAPIQLINTSVTVAKVMVEETGNCRASYELN